MSELAPGGAATSAALEYEMLVGEGVRTRPRRVRADRRVRDRLLLLGVLALPLVMLGVRVPAKLLDAAWISALVLLGIVLIGSLALGGDRFLTAIGRATQSTLNRLRRSARPVRNLPEKLLAQRTAVADALGRH